MSNIDTVLLKPNSQNNFEIIKQENVNRATFFGDGLFETMVYTDGKIRFSESHQGRLHEGLLQLKLIPDSITPIVKLENFLNKNYPIHTQLRIRWNVYRAGLGKYTPQRYDCEERFLIQPFSLPPKIKNEAYISSQITVAKHPWSHCKTLNALTYVMANIERSEKGMDEVILKDDRAFVSEGGAANIFWLKEGCYYTPSLSCGCIAGVARKNVIDQLRIHDKKVIEGEFTQEELLQAEQVFTTNVTGISYIKKIMDKEFETTPISMIESIFL